MKQEILQDIKSAAKSDFCSIQRCINKKQTNVVASIQNIRYVAEDSIVTATCSFDLSGDTVEASINYECTKDGICSDRVISRMARDILGAVSSGTTPIMAADDDEFSFDEFDETEEIDAEPTEDEEVVEDETEEDEELEDPMEDTHIDTDNNIAGHYIVECDMCKGIFISALMESDQLVDHISGVCPLCEKESDQYIKWVIKDVEF